MKVWKRPWVDNQQKKMSRRQLRRAKPSKWVDDYISKPTIECRKDNHDECPIPEKCPCYCHRVSKEMDVV